MEQFIVNQIGKIKIDEEGMCIEIFPEYKMALKELDDFSHVNVFWWFSDYDNEKARAVLESNSPYKGSPDIMGIFATRSPFRPNPIALTIAQILYIDQKKGVVYISYIDANNDTPVIDLKPYTPSLDRVENPTVPNWCNHWPKSLEQSADFDWENQFNF